MLHSLFAKHLNARRAVGKSGKKGKIVQIPWRNVWKFSCAFFPFFFSSLFAISTGAEWQLQSSTYPQTGSKVAKLCLNQKSQQTSEGCQRCFVCGCLSVCLSVCLSTLGCACCEVNVAHILYPAFWLLSIAYYPLPPPLFLPLFFCFIPCWNYFRGKSTNNAFVLIKLAPLLICLQYTVFLAKQGARGSARGVSDRRSKLAATLAVKCKKRLFLSSSSAIFFFFFVHVESAQRGLLPHGRMCVWLGEREREREAAARVMLSKQSRL